MSVSKTNAEYYIRRRDYVEGALQMALAPIRSFDGIEYTKKTLTGEEYVKVSDLTGATMFLDVTDMTQPEILKDIARLLLMGDIEDSRVIPHGFVTDDEEKLAIAELFREERADV